MVASLQQGISVSEVWDQMKSDGCLFANGNFIVARVFETSKPGVYHFPAKCPADRVRVYHVERGVEMCLGVKNFMTKSITVEPFYVDLEESEESQGEQVLPPLAQEQLQLKSLLGEDETQDGWRLKDKHGEVILTVYMRSIAA